MTQDTDPERRIATELTRRKLLYGSAVGMMGLSGCGGDGGDTGDSDSDGDSDGSSGEGGEFVIPTFDNPDQTTFSDWFPNEMETRYESSGDVFWAMFERGIWGRIWADTYNFKPGELYKGFVDDWEFTQDGIIFTIRDDATWSDGEDITALDLGFTAAQRKIAAVEGLYDGDFLAPTEQGSVANRVGTWDDIEYPDGEDGKKVKYVNTAYPDANIIERHIDNFQGGDWWQEEIDRVLPSHIEPYNEWMDVVFDTLEEARETNEAPDFEAIVQENISEADLEMLRDPDNMVSNGAFALDDVRGAQEFVLTKNEHHRHADEIGFDTVRMPWVDSDNRLLAELQTGRLDYAELLIQQEEVINQLQNTYELQRVPRLEKGRYIGFRQEGLESNREFRAAIMYALDHDAIAESFHPRATVPLKTPAGDMYGTDAWYSQEWQDNNLVTYNQDRERATTLMEEAGASRQGGEWTFEGEPLEYTLPSLADSPVVEPVIADQLGDFGIAVEVLKLNEQDYLERLNQGEFDMWPRAQGGDRWGGGLIRSIFSNWLHALQSPGDCRYYYMFRPIETLEEMIANEEWGWRDRIVEANPYVEIPPIGEPDGELQQYHVAMESMKHFYEGQGGPADREEFIKRASWTLNWFMPVCQLFNMQTHLWTKTSEFTFPQDHDTWQYFGTVIPTVAYLANGMIR